MMTAATKGANAKLAEVALRNLQLNGLAGPDEQRFHSRVLRLRSDGLVIEIPADPDQPVALAPGVPVVLSCQLGREALRFSAEVKGPTSCRLGNGEETPAILLGKLSEPKVVQGRRHRRIQLEATEPVGASLWVMDIDESGRARVVEEIHGQVSDISAGGVCVAMDHVMWVPFISEHQLWIRIMLPDERESLIFRAKPLHVGEPDEAGIHRVGLQFTEAIEPGQHQRITEQLAHFMARQDNPIADGPDEARADAPAMQKRA